MAKERFAQGRRPRQAAQSRKGKEGLITFKNIELWQITRMTKFISNRQCGGKS